MTWQEELRKLDESLASGSLSADEYRARRDQILSSAVTSSEQQPQEGQTNADSTQIIEPVSPSQGTPQQQPSQPQQHPQQQASQPQQHPQQQPSQAESTQVVQPADTGAERTQVVQNWQSQQPHAQSSPPQGFQQPQQQYPSSPPGGFAGPQQQQQQQYQQQQQPWNAPQEDASPPWGGSDFPPIAPQGSSEWGVSQGPESFESESKPGSGRKVLFSVAGVVLVVGIAFAVWALFINGGDDQQAQQDTGNSQSQQPQPTSTPLPKPPEPKAEPADNAAAIVDPPGEKRNGGGSFNLEQLKQNQMLPEPMVQALDDAGMGDGLLKTTRDGEAVIGLYSIEVSNEDAAIAAAEEYGVIQQEGGIPAVRDLSLQGVQVYGAGNADSDSVFRAVYVLYDRVVIIDVTGPNRDELESTFSSLLDEQLDQAPPSHTGS
ncbi:flagellar basal body protein FliL [Prauserella cavernicola]|uniref:Flagellar basal body protein FliL n=1 Tax=Prauserella cavernicola TaxID=2800127 RepID=A0A934V488_9PSEU|nr:flagellar basal body protein FliL [Prauserella cavernicola]MBK1784464.1 flagellar basal body protein FliL [Prauserella cavernicola]